MIKKVINTFRNNPPKFTLLFLAGMLFTTLPQFFLNAEYSIITGRLASWQNLYYFTLPVFSHSPPILFLHLLVNSVVFLVFGSLTEIMVGPRRFALVSLTTFITSQMLVYLMRFTSMHGISGVGWGYHIFGLFFLILMVEQSENKARFDPLTYLLGGLLLINFFGVPAFEVIIQGWPLLANFGQYMHLASVVVCIPYLLAWRADIVESFQHILHQKELTYPESPSFALWMIMFIFILNSAGTIIAVISSSH